MEDHYQSLSPSQGWLAGTNQDFRHGAKGLYSLHPVSTPSPLNISIYNEHLNDWMESSEETLGYTGLEAFSEVLLPDECENYNVNKNLGDHEFQDDIFIDSSLNDISSPFQISASQQTHSGVSKEPVVIRLKKVRIPKKHSQPISNEFAIYDYERTASTPQRESSPLHFTEPLPGETLFTFDTEIDMSECPQELVQDFDLQSLDHLLNEESIELQLTEDNSYVIDNVSNITLKDALNMENADLILENYLSPTHSHVSQSPSQSWQLSPSISALDEQILSPYSESLLSPSSIHHSESVLSEVYYEGDLGSSSTQTKIKPRKKRERLTPESRYLRKKEQNKQAALRYRAKKKGEEEELSDTLKEEEKTRDLWKKELGNVSQEIQFMKKIMRETFIAKKLVPPDAFD